MGISTYKPEWQTATPMEFKSDNPLIPGPVELEVYTVVVDDTDDSGKKIGEHQETIITYASLKKWYAKNLMNNGGHVSFEISPGIKNGVIVKCTLTKGDTHIEEIGEASLDNCFTDISRNYPATTAGNRAFCRVMFWYLNLNLDEMSDGIVRTEADLLDRPTTCEESKPSAPVTPRASDSPTWFNTPAKVPLPPPAEKAPTGERAPAATVTNAATLPEPQPVAEKASAKSNPDEEFKEDRLAAARTQYTDQEYDNLLKSEFHGLSNCPFNGRPVSEMIDLVRSKDPEACRAIQAFVKYRPFQSDRLPAWKCLISYLNKNGLIQLYPTGKFFVGVK